MEEKIYKKYDYHTFTGFSGLLGALRYEDRKKVLLFMRDKFTNGKLSNDSILALIDKEFGANMRCKTKEALSVPAKPENNENKQNIKKPRGLLSIIFGANRK